MNILATRHMVGWWLVSPLITSFVSHNQIATVSIAAVGQKLLCLTPFLLIEFVYIWQANFEVLNFLGALQNCENRLLASSLLSIWQSFRPHETIRLPREAFSLNLWSEYFSKICWENSSLLLCGSKIFYV